MLSRIAESLFWIGRYTERADGTARIFTWTHAAFEVMYGWSRMTQRLAPLYGEEACTRSNTSMDRAHGTGF